MSATAARALAAAGITAFVAWAAYVIGSDRSGLAAIAAARWDRLAGVAALNLLFLGFNGLYLRRVMASFEIALGAGESLHLSVATTALNSFLPLTPGAALRAYYLRQAHGLAVSRFLGVLAGTYVLNYFVAFLAGVVASAYLYLGWGLLDPLLAAVFGCGLALFAALVFFPRWVPRPRGRLGERLARALASWATMAGDRALVRDVALFVLANLVTTAALLYVALAAVGVETRFAPLLYVATVSTLGLFIKLTPGNLGVTEALMVLGGTTLEIPVADTLLAALIVRVTLYAVLVVLFPWSMRALFRDGWRAALRDTTGG